MEQPTERTNNTGLGEKLLMLIVIVSIIIGISITFFTQRKTDENNVNENSNVIAPNINVPSNINSGAVENPQTFLISQPYEINSNPYENYDQNAFRVAISGKFKELILDVEGTITDNKEKFVSLNFGLQSGVLNAIRKNESTLDYEKTLAQGGVFTNSIDFSVDLFAPTVLATSKDEFINTRQTSRTVIFQDSISPTPNVFTMLVAPFNADGSYTGVKIEKIQFQYRCEGPEESCQIASCESGQLFTTCLADNFGKQSALDWCTRTDAEGCENLK